MSVTVNQIEKRRIPELPAWMQYVASLSRKDKIPYWLHEVDKTVWVETGDLGTLLSLGNTSSYAPVYLGGRIFKKVSPSEAGVQVLSLPSLAGKDFYLERGGYPLIPRNPSIPDPANDTDAQYEILSGGGFKLLQTGDVLGVDELFTMQPSSLVAGATGVTTTGGALFTGKAVIQSSRTFSPTNDLGKIVQFRTGSTQATLTLPLLADIPANTVIVIESAINNTVQNRVTTQGGQNIYMNGTSYTSLYLAPGETLYLYRDTDGYTVWNDFGKVYNDLAVPKPAFRAGLNQKVLNGSLLKRSDYPRMWELVDSLGVSTVDESTWQTAAVYKKGGQFFTSPPSGIYKTIERPYRGCFSRGTVTTGPDANFRLPDWMNMTFRGLKSETGSDFERYYNKPGGYQEADTIDTGGQDDANPTDGVDTGLSYAAGSAHFRRRGTEIRGEGIGGLWVTNV